MKKSFIIASIFLGILVISLVSAGLFDRFTGNVIWDWNHCSSSNQCPASEGDCDRDSECTANLICKNNVGKEYGQHALMDVCECPEDKPIQFYGKCVASLEGYTADQSNLNEILQQNLRPYSLRLDYLNGDSNAYACLDKDGELFRSITPCA